MILTPSILSLSALLLGAPADDAKSVRIAGGVSGHIHPAVCVTRRS